MKKRGLGRKLLELSMISLSGSQRNFRCRTALSLRISASGTPGSIMSEQHDKKPRACGCVTRVATWRTGACAPGGELPTGSYQKSVHPEGQRQAQAAGHLDRAGSGLHASNNAGAGAGVCTENLIRVDEVTESPKLAG